MLGIPWQSNGYNSALPLPRSPGSIPSWGIKIPQAMRHGQKKKISVNVIGLKAYKVWFLTTMNVN